MIRLERDPAFWVKIASHPALAGAMMGLDAATVGALATRDDMTPLASEHGGFFFARTDPMGFSCELHTLFTPEGWGREVFVAAIAAFDKIFAMGYQLVTTFEVRENRRSRPPKTFGFSMCEDWRESPLGDLRLWILTAGAFRNSPALRTVKCH